MYKATFGTQNQIQFSSEKDFYELLGYLAKSDGTSSIVWEHNEDQGAWGSEGRIQFYTDSLPFTANLPYSAGVGAIVKRVNCNEFVKYIIDNHGFITGKNQDISNIKATIPAEYMPDFERGYSM